MAICCYHGKKTLTPPLLQIDMREEIDMQTKCAES